MSSPRKIIIKKPNPSPRPVTRSTTRLNHTPLLSTAEIAAIPVDPQPTELSPPTPSASQTPAKSAPTSKIKKPDLIETLSAMTDKNQSTSILSTRPSGPIRTLSTTSDDDADETGAYRRQTPNEEQASAAASGPPNVPVNSPKAGELSWNMEDVTPSRIYSREELEEMNDKKNEKRLTAKEAAQKKFDEVTDFISENYPPETLFKPKYLRVLDEQPDLKADRVAEIVENLKSDDKMYSDKEEISGMIKNCMGNREIEKINIARHKENIEKTEYESVRVNETKRCWRRRTNLFEADLRIDRFFMRLKCVNDEDYFQKVKNKENEKLIEDRRKNSRVRKTRNQNKRRAAKKAAERAEQPEPPCGSGGSKTKTSPEQVDARQKISNQPGDARQIIQANDRDRSDAREAIRSRERQDARNRISSRDRYDDRDRHDRNRYDRSVRDDRDRYDRDRYDRERYDARDRYDRDRYAAREASRDRYVADRFGSLDHRHRYGQDTRRSRY